jgi:predicted transcriptional regulator
MNTGLLQYTHFDPPRARSGDPDTSHLAADSMTNGSSIQRRQIMQLLVTVPGGLNASEIDVELGWPSATTSRRMCELRRAGLVVREGKRETPIGHRLAYVYCVTEAGREWAY